MYHWVIFIIVFLIISLILFIKIKLEVDVNINGLRPEIFIYFVALKGIIRYRYKFKMSDSDSDNDSIVFKTREKLMNMAGADSEDKEKQDVNGVYNKFKNYIDRYFKYKTLYDSVMSYLKNKIVLEKIYINMKIGTGEASYTAILIGLIWGILGSFLSILANNIKTKEKNIVVTPDFNGMTFNTKFNCIITLKLVNIMCVGLMMINFNLHYNKRTIGQEKMTSKF